MTVTADSLVETPLERRFLECSRPVASRAGMDRHGVRCVLLVEKLARKGALDRPRGVLVCGALDPAFSLHPGNGALDPLAPRRELDAELLAGLGVVGARPPLQEQQLSFAE